MQQISKGFVWMHHTDTAQARTPALFFLFFALAFWPFWFPVLTTIMEPQPKRKWVFAAISLAATAWFWVLLLSAARWPRIAARNRKDAPFHPILITTPCRSTCTSTSCRCADPLSAFRRNPPRVRLRILGPLPGLVLGASRIAGGAALQLRVCFGLVLLRGGAGRVSLRRFLSPPKARNPHGPIVARADCDFLAGRWLDTCKRIA